MIRTATVADLEQAGERIGKLFYAEIGRPFVMEIYLRFYTTLIESGMGVMFLLVDGEVIQGGIAGLATPDPHNGMFIASELFWFVMPEARGGLGAGRLYKAFETWAIEQCCSEIQMVHLEKFTPERLEGFYVKQGYEKIETRYSKVLQRFESKEAA